jgi:DNA processing protein
MEEFTIPEKLRQIPHPPKKLYIRGNFPIANKYLCIIGGRKHSEYGKRACEYLLEGLCKKSIAIISGLALGIDTVAHESAINNDLKTIAFPGSGLNDEVLYPALHRKCAHRIIENDGCLISENEPDAKAQIWSFPQRNRLMAGLADAVLIIESKLKSGTLITAKLALDYNKTVLAVPGSIFSPYSEGPHFLIHSGATPVRTSADILNAIGMSIDQNIDGTPSIEKIIDELRESCSKNELAIINELTIPRQRDELARSLSLPAADLSISLSLLEIKGYVEEKFGYIYLKL